MSNFIYSLIFNGSRYPMTATKPSSPMSSTSQPRTRGQGSAKMPMSSHSQIKGQGRLTKK